MGACCTRANVARLSPQIPRLPFSDMYRPRQHRWAYAYCMTVCWLKLCPHVERSKKACTCSLESLVLLKTPWMKWHLKLLHRLADRLARLPGIASPWLANDSFDGLRLQKAVEVNPGPS